MRPHLLAVRSLLLGTCNILVVGVPAGWRVVDGLFPPEVDRWHIRGEVSWAVAGRGAWRLVGPGPGGGTAKVDLALSLAPWRRGEAPDPATALHRAHVAGSVPMGGHTALWALGEVRRGLLRRAVPALAASLVCPETARSLRLLLEGAEPGDLQALLGALAEGTLCH